MPTNESLFIPVNIAVLTVSDTRSPDNDASGKLLRERIVHAGHRIVAAEIVRDDIDAIEAALRRLMGEGNADVILSTGGTGITGRDVTPEAFARVIEKDLPGFGELFRMLSYQKIGSSAILSRAVGGVSQGIYLFALPGSPAAVADAWDMILQPQLDIRTQPGNLVRLRKRLCER